jgi:hypothetical protein
MAKPKKLEIDPIREAQKDFWIFALKMRQKYELHTNDIPDLLEAVAIKWFIENCRAEFIFKQHSIEGYSDAIRVVHAGDKVKIERVEDTTPPLNINSGLFRSMR